MFVLHAMNATGVSATRLFVVEPVAMKLLLLQLVADEVPGSIALLEGEAPGIRDDDLRGRRPPEGPEHLDLRQHVDALQDHPENLVDPVEPLRLGGVDEPLRPVRVRFPSAVVRHAEQVHPVVLDGEGFVLEIVSGEDALPSGPVAVGVVPPLDEEVRDHAVDDGILVAHLLPGDGSLLPPVAPAERREVLDGLRGDLPEQTEDDPTQFLPTRGDVHEDALGDEGKRWYGIHFRR